MSNNAKPTGSELTLVAKYSSDYEDAKTILSAARAHEWAPATTEWIDIAHQSKTAVREVGDTVLFLHAIQVRQEGRRGGNPPRAPGSLRRINLWAHGDAKGNISFNGKVSRPKAIGTADVSIADGLGVLDPSSLDQMENQSAEQAERSAKIFATGGEIYIYACNSGVSEDVMQRLADYYQVTVFGFRGKIIYCPLQKGLPGMQRGESGLFFKVAEDTRGVTGGPDPCDKGEGVYDFHKLLPSITKYHNKKRSDTKK